MKNYLIILSLFIFSCNSDDLLKTKKCELKNSHFSFLELFGDRYGTILGNPDSSGLIKFSYDELGNIVKASGGLLHLDQATGFDATFSDEVYDSIVHNSNSIKIYKKYYDYDDHNDLSFELNERKLPIKRITISNIFTYKYLNNKVVESIDKDDIKYSFEYVNSNLIKIEAIIYDNITNDGLTVIERVIRTFEEYDDKENPFKGLFYVRGAFYKSLSENNYKKHCYVREKRIGDEDWQTLESYFFTSDFEYDENDLPNFGDYNCN